MKILSVIWGKLWELMRRNTFVFVMLCIGIFASNMMFTYFYGNIKYTSEHAGHTVIEIQNSTENSMTARELTLKLQAYDIADIEFTSLYTGKEPLPVEYTEAAITGSAYTLISYGMRESADLIPVSVRVETNTSQRAISTSELLELLREQYGDDYTVEELKTINKEFWKQIAVVLAVYLASIISMLFLMTYLYEDTAKELNVYETLGATRGQVVWIMTSVQLVLLVTFSVLAQLAHWVLYEPLFAKLAWNERVTYTFADYAVISGVTVLLVLAFVVLFLAFRTRGSVIEAKRRVI